MTTYRGSHRTGYFTRPSHEWEIVAFLDYMMQHHAAMASRSILSFWMTTLSQVAKCRCQRLCCTGPDRARAKTLLKSFKCRGMNSQRRTAGNHLRDNRPPMPSSSAVTNNYNTTVANHGSIGNLHSGSGSASAGEVTASISLAGGAGTAAALRDQATSTPASSNAEDAPSPDESAYDSSFSTRSGRVWDSFAKSFAAFDDERKWKLPSGKTVEDIIYGSMLEQPLSTPVEAMLHNWVVDVSNPKMQTLFSKRDWSAIEACVPQLPVANEEFESFLAQFSEVKDTGALEDMMCSTPLCSRDARDSKLRSDMRWAKSVIDQFLRLWESESKPLSSDHLEDWYTNNIWCRLLDDCLLALPNVHLERKEVACQSSSLRQNRKRDDPADRQKAGPRLDGILRGADDSSHEFCAIEAAPSLRGGALSTKWLTDKAKLVIVLRDMLGRLVSLSGHDAAIAQQLQVVGISFAGRMMQPARLCHGKGYVMLLASEPLSTVPSEVGQLRDLVDVLPSILRLRAVLRTTIEAFRGRAGNGPRVCGGDAAAAPEERIPKQPSPADGS